MAGSASDSVPPGREMIYRVIGRGSLAFDFLRELLGRRRHWRPDTNSNAEPDETGRVADETSGSDILWDDGDVLFVKHGRLNHSFARAQEFSLIRRHKGVLKRPIVDFGCGDGSFASMLFTQIDYGVDVDGAALEKAGGFHTYTALVRCSDEKIPLPDGAAWSVVSNSVLEHLNDLNAIITELHRILCPGGKLLFTVPLKQYERDLIKYFGRWAARRVNQESYHRNLLEMEDWKRQLEGAGFVIERMEYYQPGWFTFWYRMLRLFGRKGLSMIVPGIDLIVWRKYQTTLVELVRTSIHDTIVGGNMLVIASKVQS